MKVIFSYALPFSLAHGGQQTLIQSLMRELGALGVDVQPERWWDADQTADIVQYIDRPNSGNIFLAKQKGRKLVLMENPDVVASESDARIARRATLTKLARRYISGVRNRLDFYNYIDAFVYVVPHELDYVNRVYDVPKEKGHIIGHGLEPEALKRLSMPQAEGDYLLCMGTICPRKNSVLLAECARMAEVPVLFIGKPFSQDDPYFQQFMKLVDGKYVRYTGYVGEEEKYERLRGAKGFALLSIGESGCIAVYEAAAAGLPLFLPELPWAVHGYPQSNRIQTVKLNSKERIAEKLKAFYLSAHRGAETFPVPTWREVALSYLSIYEKLLRTS